MEKNRATLWFMTWLPELQTVASAVIRTELTESQ